MRRSETAQAKENVEETKKKPENEKKSAARTEREMYGTLFYFLSFLSFYSTTK